MKKRLILFLLLLLPLRVFAYSNYLVVTGEPIGIEIHSNGVYVVDHYNSLNSSIHKGDRIIEVNQQKIESISDLDHVIDAPGTYTIKLERNHKILDDQLFVTREQNQIKTGLYIKDEINGIGTLSYIDPETKIFASLGHEVIESSSNSLFELKNGLLYAVDGEMIQRNQNGQIGEIRANFTNTILGSIDSNQMNGIYGFYQESISGDHLYEVSKKDEIELGDASLLLNVDHQEKEYTIQILDVDYKDSVKNIYFEVTDSALLNMTGGIIQGMSGSPILQNHKIIGAVNYVVVNHPKTGYGVFIESMLEEGDKLLQS